MHGRIQGVVEGIMMIDKERSLCQNTRGLHRQGVRNGLMKERVLHDGIEEKGMSFNIETTSDSARQPGEQCVCFAHDRPLVMQSQRPLVNQLHKAAFRDGMSGAEPIDGGPALFEWMPRPDFCSSCPLGFDSDR
jgi:hypothetical protein